MFKLLILETPLWQYTMSVNQKTPPKSLKDLEWKKGMLTVLPSHLALGGYACARVYVCVATDILDFIEFQHRLLYVNIDSHKCI